MRALMVVPYNKHNVYLRSVLCFFLVSFIFSCRPAADEDKSEDEQQLVTEQNSISAENVFKSMPDKNMVMELIEKNQIEYNPDLLNDPESLKKYTTEFYKAVNLGIYGSDLSISNSFNKTQESLIFLKCVNRLATDLNVSKAFDKQTIDRLESNNNNKDSLLDIVTNAFRQVDDILKNSNRSSTSAIILSGCWVEGLYVSCKLALGSGSPEIVKAIIEQEKSLAGLITMLESVKGDADTDFVLKDLKQIQLNFKKSASLSGAGPEALTEISKEVDTLRQKLIAG